MKLPTKPEIDKYLISTEMCSMFDYDETEYKFIVDKHSFDTLDHHQEFREAVLELGKELQKINARLVRAYLSIEPDSWYGTVYLTIFYYEERNKK